MLALENDDVLVLNTIIKKVKNSEGLFIVFFPVLEMYSSQL